MCVISKYYYYANTTIVFKIEIKKEMKLINLNLNVDRTKKKYQVK